MKYCVKCGNKLNENVNYCSKCGNSLINNKEKPKEKNKEDNKEKLLLIIGTILIIIASIAFAFANWNEMSSMFKVLFLSIECLLFLSLAIFSKRVGFKIPYKFLWFIGIAFIPIIFNLIGADKLLGDYLSYDGNGMYVYLAISTLICAIIY